jgi:hypothetical protein
MRKLYAAFTLIFLLSWTIMPAQGSCDITNLTVVASSCIDGMFEVEIDFDIVNPEGNIFGVVGNVTNYGFFMYDSLPITLGQLVGDGTIDYEFIVYDLGERN